MAHINEVMAKYGMEKIAARDGIEEYRLPNGLKILLIENHIAPVVFHQVIYKVGSKNEGTGHTGATHMLEHLLFKCVYGRFDSDKGTSMDQLLKPIGGINNASTWLERTNYWEHVPAEHKEICMEMEATRMRQLILEKRHRDSEMTVVRSELEIGENDPDSVLFDSMLSTVFKEHPYKYPTIGYRTDVEGMPMEALQKFYDKFYYPNNAVLVICGDIEPAQTLDQVGNYFADIPASKHEIPQIYTVEPQQQGPRNFVIRRSGDKARLILGYRACPVSNPDFYVLSMIASLLGGSRATDRLYKALVDTSYSTDVSAMIPWLRDDGVFVIGADVIPGKSPKRVKKLIQATLQRLKKGDVSEAELDRIKIENSKGTRITASNPRSFCGSLITEAEAAADWQWLLDFDDHFNKVTVKDVQKVARKYFKNDSLTTGIFIPKKAKSSSEIKAQVAAQDNSSQADDTALEISDVKSDVQADVKSEPALLQQDNGKGSNYAERTTRLVLNNGMTVLSLSVPQPGVEPGTGTVGVTLGIKAGTSAASRDKQSVASMVAEMLTRGSAKYSKEALAEAMQLMGSDLDISAGRLYAGGGSNIVAEDLEKYLNILADILRNPQFSQEELDKLKLEYLTWVEGTEDSTKDRAGMALASALYPEDSPLHPLSFEEQRRQIQAVTIDDLKQFFAENYSPAGMVLSIVGDIDPSRAIELVKANFADWTGPQPKPWFDFQRRARVEVKRVNVFLADKANVSMSVGLPLSLKRTAKAYFAARIANAVLGEQTFGSRLGERLRVVEGLTYGSRSGFGERFVDGEPWVITLNVNPTNVEKAVDCIFDEVRKLLDGGPTEKEISENIGETAGNFVLQLSRPIAVSSALLQYEISGLGLAALDQFVLDMRTVTLADVWNFLKENLVPENIVVAAAGSHKQ